MKGLNLKEEFKRVVLEMKALVDAPPGKFDPEKAGKLRAEFTALALIHNAKQDAISDRAYFAWLTKNVPALSTTRGRPRWIESEKVMQRDKTLMQEFEKRRRSNIDANRGKKFRASQKAYSDLADNDAVVDDEYTMKQKVIRARRRQKALNQFIQEILDLAALAANDQSNPPTAKDYKERRKKLIAAFRRIV